MQSTLFHRTEEMVKKHRAAVPAAVIATVALFVFGHIAVDRAYHVHQRLPSGIVIKSDILDFGTISWGGSYTSHLILKNVGALTYKIDSITPECGCTVVRKPDGMLLPKSSVDIPVTVNSRGWGEGLRTKRVAIRLSDDTGRPGDLLIKVVATVEKVTLLHIIPTQIDIVGAHSGETREASLYARGDRSVVTELPDRVDCGSALQAQVAIHPKELDLYPASREIKVLIRVPQSHAPGAEPATGSIEFRLSGVHAQQLEIPITVRFHE